MLAQIKNAQAAGREEVVVPFSKLKLAVAKILQTEGFLVGVEEKKKKAKKAELSYLHLALQPGAINGVRLVSKPSRRIYAHAEELRKIRGGFGIAVISTSRGIMTGGAARRAGVGGELLFEIW